MTPQEIKQVRLDADLSQTKLAKLLGVHVQSVYHWEHGVTVPNEAAQKGLADLKAATERGEKPVLPVLPPKAKPAPRAPSLPAIQNIPVMRAYTEADVDKAIELLSLVRLIVSKLS